MIDTFPQFSPLAILAATVAHTVLAGIWFTALFGKTYARIQGIDAAPTGLRYVIGPTLCSLVTIVATAMLLPALGVQTLAGAVGVGLFVGIGYVAPTVVNIAINPFFPRPVAYSILNVPVFVLGSMLASAILFALS